MKKEKTKHSGEDTRKKFAEDRKPMSKKTDMIKMTSTDSFTGERYRDFIENISDGVYETDIYGNFTYFNNSHCKIFGYSRTEIQGANFASFMDTKHARSAYNVFTKIWVTHEGFSDVLWEIVDKEGQTRIIELSAHLVRDKKKKKIGFRGITRDVTEKIRAQEDLRKSEADYQRMYEVSRRAEKRARNLLDFVPYPMVVLRQDRKVNYVNPAFTETFGWTIEELRGKQIPYIPPDLRKETREGIKSLYKRKFIHRFESRRLTKDGRVLDVLMRIALFDEGEGEETGELVILRDVTQEKRMALDKEALLRISTALPAYPELERLLDYISNEIRVLLNAEAALVILLDEEKNEFSYVGAAHEDMVAQKKIKAFHFPADKSVAGKVVRTGKPIIVADVSKDPDFFTGVDSQIGFKTKNMLEVPLRSSDRIIGVLCARNKREGGFDQADIEFLTMIAGTVVLFIENARVSEELKAAYKEVTSMNRAKDKVINHLSHELKTPLSVLMGSLDILTKKMTPIPEETWRPIIERAQRNLNRLLEIQYQTEDIMQHRDYMTHRLLSVLLDQCSDELETLVAQEVGDGPVTSRIRKRIEEMFGPKEALVSKIDLGSYVRERLDDLKTRSGHREVEIITHIKQAPPICIPPDVLQKVVDGLVKNAIENTPDEGKVVVSVKKRGKGTELVVHDYGVGITEENQRRIFEGFFATQDTMAYSTKNPFDFNAGGKGTELLRIKIFSERYDFKIDMVSSRCRFIPKESDICPGRISQCSFCSDKEVCYHSGSTRFSLFFPIP
jgi:PAS domain S-box-containing protein